MDAGRIDPTVVEVEQGTDGDGVVDLFVGPVGFAQGLHVFSGDLWRVVVHFVEEAEEEFFGVGQGGGFIIRQYGFDEGMVL